MTLFSIYFPTAAAGYLSLGDCVKENVINSMSDGALKKGIAINSINYIDTVRPATALFLVPGIYSAIENSANGGSCYLVSCKFLQKIVL